jgi:hypothetical protein
MILKNEKFETKKYERLFAQKTLISSKVINTKRKMKDQ